MIKTIKKVRAPVRIDFAGGTTDIKPFTDIYGGAVLNAAINRYVYGTLIKTSKKTKLEYHANIPTASGLGTSSAMNVVWLALITQNKDKQKIAEAVFKIEQASKESSFNGKQDQYASVLGGINYLEFFKDKVKIYPIKLDKKFLEEFNNRLVLVYSGEEHYSGDSNKYAIENFLKNKNTKNLLRLKSIAKEMRECLLKKDLQKFAYLMNEETKERKKLSKISLTKNTKKIIEIGFKNEAIGAKICGSGNGGSVLFFSENKKRLIETFKKRVIDFKFDFEGLKWLN